MSYYPPRLRMVNALFRGLWWLVSYPLKQLIRKQDVDQ